MPWLGSLLRDAIKHQDFGIALTGAGSWLGQALLAALAAEDALPLASKFRLFGSTERSMRLGGKTYRVEDLSDASPLTGGPWLLLHFAFLGKERTTDLSACDFIAANNQILDRVIRLATPADALRVVFSSSGAVYKNGREPYPEHDHSDPYGCCKVLHERRLTEWCAERNILIVIPRIFNIGGPFINKVTSYALSSFIQSARTSGAIRINARGPTYRSYVHVNELLAVAIDTALAATAITPMVFDTAGQEVVEMADLAAAVCRTLGIRGLIIERPRFRDGPTNRYVGDGASYRALLSARGRDMAPLSRIIEDTAAFLETTAAHHALSG